MTTFSSALQKHDYTLSYSPKQNFCNVTKAMSIPKAGVPVLAKSDDIQLNSLLFWKRSVYLPTFQLDDDSKSLAGPVEATGVLSAVMRN